MPAALKNVDWALAHSLYQEGVALKNVASRTGIPYTTLTKRALRHKWQQLVLPQELAPTPKPSKHTPEKAVRWTERMSQMVERYMSRIEDKERHDEDMDLDTLEQLVRITDATDRTARRTFGMDNERHDHLSIHVQSELAPAQPRQLPAQSDEVVDVETVPTVPISDTPVPEQPK